MKSSQATSKAAIAGAGIRRLNGSSSSTAIRALSISLPWPQPKWRLSTATIPRKLFCLNSRKIMEIVDQRDGVILWHNSTRYGVKLALEFLASQGHQIHLIVGTSIAILRYIDGEEQRLIY